MENKITSKFNILAVILIVVFAISLTPITLQNDTFYSIKIGEYILEKGITMQDPFSWHENLPYVFPHWAYDVCTYFIYSIGNFFGIYIATVVLTSILGLAIYFTNVKISKSNLISFVITMFALYFMKNYITARAQLVTFILFILTIFLIEMFLETGKKRYAVGLIIIPIIIANIHVAVWPFYFVLYLPYIAEYFFACLSRADISWRNRKINKLNKQLLEENLTEKIDQIKEKIAQLENANKESEERKEKLKKNAYKLDVVLNKNVKWLILIAIICLFTGLLTPLQDTPYTYLIKTMQGNTTQFINEHLPLTLINNIEFMLVIILFLAILIFTDTKIRLSDFFMLAGLLLLTFKTKRQESMFVLICTVILNRLACSIFEKYDREGIRKVTKLLITIPGKLITIGLVLIISFAFVSKRANNKLVSESSYPVDASKYIKENIDLSTMRLYNEYNYGSYLLLQGIPVFIDSRADLYAPEFNGGKDIFSDFIDTNNIGKYYEDTMEKYHITHVILYKNARLNMFISRDSKYEQLYSDDYFVVYKRGN